WHNGEDDIYYVLNNLDDFGGVLQFRWQDALKQKSFTQQQLILQSGDKLKGIHVRLLAPHGYSFVLSSTSPVPASYHRSYSSDELNFDLKDQTGSWRTLSDLSAVFESDSRRTLRDALLIILSAIIGLGLAIVTERADPA